MLETFLDGIPGRDKDEARLLVHGMRLFALSAQKDLSPKVDLPILAARTALRDLQVKQLENAMGTVLGMLLQNPTKEHEDQCFGTWPECRWLGKYRTQASGGEGASTSSPEDAWEYLRECLPAEMKLPVPGTPRIRVAGELLGLARKLHLRQAWILLWKARHDWVVRGPIHAGQAFAQWSKQFEPRTFPRLAREVATHRAALALGVGEIGKARALLEVAGNATSWLAFADKGPLDDGVTQEAPLGGGPDPRASVDGKTSRVDASVSGAEAWRWDGTWGSLGCWVALCPPGEGMRWVQTPKGSPQGQAEPDGLEAKAMARLGLVVSSSGDRTGVVPGARSIDARVRVCVCVWITGENLANGLVRPGRIAGWVTWEWNHYVMPPAGELIAAAKRLVLQPQAENQSHEGGTTGRLVPETPVGPAFRSWFGGLADRNGICSPVALWQLIGEDWVKVYSAPGSAEQGDTPLLDPSLHDLKRCVQVRSCAVYWSEDPSTFGELVPLVQGQVVTAIIVLHASATVQGSQPNTLGPVEAVLWNLARYLDGCDGRDGLAGHMPLGDPSFALFIGRLAVARELDQHVALVGHGQGLGRVLAEWLGGWKASGPRKPWRCDWIRNDGVGTAAYRGVLRRWEGEAEPFQVFHLPTLSNRRNEIVEWIHRIGAQRDSGVEWQDAAVAAMWRQPWQGQERQLASVVLRLIQAATGPISRRHVETALSERGIDVVIRLDSRSPLPSDVSSALFVTRSKSGRTNKSRASMYLGWDPDTLVARMGDLDWLDGAIPNPDPWAAQ
ncbi:MAG: hypothetical protein GY930_08860 [bacterium]|nr:hypothetical protein [bacterium]